MKLKSCRFCDGDNLVITDIWVSHLGEYVESVECKTCCATAPLDAWNGEERRLSYVVVGEFDSLYMPPTREILGVYLNPDQARNKLASLREMQEEFEHTVRVRMEAHMIGTQNDTYRC